MMQLSLAADIVNGVLMGADRQFNGVGIDSRTITHDELFFAIQGAQFDGHDFVANSADAGAIGAVVEQVVDVDISQVKVEDATLALGQLGQNWRARFAIPVLAITGSNGKTSVVNLIRQILLVSAQPLSPTASFNNHWGVPLTLLCLSNRHTHAVIEMGLNRPGELDYLARMAAPTIALITNAAAAHLAGLGDVASVARAKAEIIHGVAEDGIVVLNADDGFFDYWKEYAAPRNVICFSALAACQNVVDVSATEIELQPQQSRFVLHLGKQSSRLTLPLSGNHNIYNALAATAMCYAADIAFDDIVQGLSGAVGVNGRLQTTITAAGAVVINDSFNANPGSIQAAIEVLSLHSGKRVLIVGAMAELGAGATAWHKKIGDLARQAGIERLMILADSSDAGARSNARDYASGFGALAEIFDSVESLVAALQQDNRSNVTLLVKGSKSSAMGRVVAQLQNCGNSAMLSKQNQRGKQC